MINVGQAEAPDNRSLSGITHSCVPPRSQRAETHLDATPACTQKKRPGLTVRFSEPPACWCSLRGQTLPLNSAIAHRRCLSACAGSMPQPHSTSHPAGAGISERSFARPQQRFRHHCEVNVPDLRLRFHATNSRESVRLSTPPLRSVSRPIQGGIFAKSPFPAPI